MKKAATHSATSIRNFRPQNLLQNKFNIVVTSDQIITLFMCDGDHNWRKGNLLIGDTYIYLQQYKSQVTDKLSYMYI